MIEAINKMKIKNTINSEKEREKKLTVICDSKTMDDKKLVGPNFGGHGVNLYYVTWNDEYIRKYRPSNAGQFSFISSELIKTGLPLVKKDGYDAVYLTKENTQNSRHNRRIYLLYAYPQWSYSLLGNTLIDSKLAEYIVGKSCKMEQNKTK